jgi:hypothetical protein
MTITFAASRSPASSPLLRAAISGVPMRAANDNMQQRSDDALLKSALRHFAEHGLGAAEQARINAEQAFFAGDRDAYRRWIDICRTLDRRMAATIAAHHSNGTPANGT